MTHIPRWLPPLVLLNNYDGDWDRYVEAIYDYFEQDFVNETPYFQENKVVIKRHPYYQGKEATFWHLISEGRIEDDRLPDLRRCERIRWPRPFIEHNNDRVIKVWKNKRGTQTRVCLWFEDQDYMVVLAERKGYVILWTAYPVTRSHRKRKLRQEYEAYIKANAAP
ncbi:MAG: hypothetical protein JXA89_02055 [Anaerolineae bacterium]|nr:hypothetical protein [Anaerolineae bacterium]